MHLLVGEQVVRAVSRYRALPELGTTMASTTHGQAIRGPHRSATWLHTDAPFRDLGAPTPRSQVATSASAFRGSALAAAEPFGAAVVDQIDAGSDPPACRIQLDIQLDITGVSSADRHPATDTVEAIAAQVACTT